MMLEHLLQTRHSVDDTAVIEDFDSNIQQQTLQTTVSTDIPPHNKRMLRRETAVELPVTPSKSNRTSLLGQDEVPIEKTENEQYQQRNLSIDRQFSNSSSPHNQQQYLLNPQSSIASGSGCGSDNQNKLFKKSCESLQKNSSTDTEYSVQPYKFIKQSSNDTNTSLTSSFNIDNSSSFTNDLSIDAEMSQNTTVIENEAMKMCSGDGCTVGLSFTKKNLDKIEPKIQQQSSIPPVSQCSVSTTLPTTSITQAKIPFSNILKDSSSSTEEHSKDDRSYIPAISTNLVQDEIAKLSSNIKSSTDDEKDPPFNETMC